MSSVPHVAPGVLYRFDRFELFPEAGQLRKNGMLVPLAPQPFRILLLLVSRAGSLVTREEIQEELWGATTFVDFDQSINAVIRRIRCALNDHVDMPRFLQTIPRRGYRFVATAERVDPLEVRASLEIMRPALVQPLPLDVEPVPTAEAVPPPHSRTWSLRLPLVLAFLAPVLLATYGPHQPTRVTTPPQTMRVLVLPLNVDGAPAGVDPRLVAAELRSRLGHVQPDRIHVVERGDADVRVDATLRAVSDGVRIDARLSEAASGRLVWSESFHRSGALSDFPLEVAVRVTRAFVGHFVPAPRREILVHSVVSARALALYTEARAICASPQPQRDLERAMALLKEAVALEPRFAEAWSAIGDVWTGHALAPTPRTPRAESIAAAREALVRATKLSPHSAEALNDLGLLAMQFDRDYAEAERYLLAAVAADADYNHAHVNLSLLFSAMGQHERAVAELRRAQIFDPMAFTGTSTMAFLYLMARRYEDATAEYEVVRLDGQRGELAQWGLLSAAIGARQWDNAARALSVLLKEPIVIPPGAHDRELAFQRQLCRLEPYLLEREQRRQIDPYVLACFYAQIDQPDRAFAALDRAATAGSMNAMFAFVDPRLDAIRGDARFAPMLARLELVR